MSVFHKIKLKLNGEFAKKSASSLILKILGLVLSYTFVLVVSRFYGAESYGKFSIAFTVLNVFALIFALGVPDAIVKMASDKSINSNYNFRKTSLNIIVISAITGSFIMYFLSGFFSDFFKDLSLERFFKVTALTLVPLILLRLNYETLRGYKNIIKFGLLSHIIPFLVALIVISSCFYFFNNVEDDTIVYGYALGVFIAMVLSFFWTYNNNTKLKKYPVKQLVNYSLPMLITSSFIFIMGWADTLMLGYFKNKSDVGVYNVVIRLARIAIVVITSINLVLAPKISELYSRSEISKMKEVIYKSTKLIFMITTPIVIIIMLGNKFILSIFGSDFITGSSALLVIMISQFFNAITGSVGQIMNMTGHHKKLSFYTILSAALNIVLNLTLIPLYGLLGAAISTALSIILLNLLSVLFVKNSLGITTYYLPFLKIKK